MSLVYEVNLAVPATLMADYEPWLRQHIAEMLALPGFEDAELFKVDSDNPDEVCLVVHYRLHDDVTWQAYIDEHAPRMRGQGIARFADRVHIERRLLQQFSATA